MKIDTYTKFILTALTVGVFALVFKSAGVDVSPVAIAEARKGENLPWTCTWLQLSPFEWEGLLNEVKPTTIVRLSEDPSQGGYVSPTARPVTCYR